MKTAMPEAPSIPPIAQPFSGREIVVAVCGGISAYKSADLVSKLVQGGAGVTVVMTRAGQQFVTPLTFQALSGRPVRTDTFDLPEASDPQHIGLTEKADLMIVAPATANIIAKAAHGICDDLVSVMICAAACPVIFCPAMNHRMWDHAVTQENCRKLAALGYPFIGPESGWLACRSVGAGRMSDPPKIIEQIIPLLSAAPQRLA